ncbi:hypothetical protein QJ043_07015 [Olsenella sp. YH-ols2217]|uniref:Uncharacterized protein n=1 Tax=Kribbibacterium absianum TaxID=3044210 RepID=A0ABT6ZLA5_9ACTN|nr:MULTISPECIES: hypothetical protein [unclassified Olsenella]MDJ1121816.1 hypothetical protein [Olsenella sp. YH-ols2216]MDJ1129824.1 hypothetical protein [Olsenella sp. YH-ols2217]
MSSGWEYTGPESLASAPPALTPVQAAAIASAHPATIRRRCSTGDIKATFFCSRWLINRDCFLQQIGMGGYAPDESQPKENPDREPATAVPSAPREQIQRDEYVKDYWRGYGWAEALISTADEKTVRAERCSLRSDRPPAFLDGWDDAVERWKWHSGRIYT